MDTIRFLVAVAIVGGLITSCTTPAGGRWPQQGVVSPSNASKPATVIPAPENVLMLSVTTEREKYMVGEPVYAAIRLGNVSQQPQRVLTSLNPEDGAVELEIASPGGERRKFVPLVETDQDATIFGELKPGAVLGNVVPLFFGGNGWTFAKPGRYTITAYYHLPVGKGVVHETRSQPVVVEIQPSEEGAWLIGERGPQTVEVGKFLTWQKGDHLEKGQAKLRELTDRYSGSALASYAHAAFARNWGDAFMHYGKREVRPPNCELAQQHLSKIRDNDVTEYIRYQGALTAARCMARAKNADGTRRYLEIAKKITGDRPEYRGLAAPLAQIEKVVGGTQ